MRAALLSPGRNWEVVRSSSTVVSQYCLSLPTLRRQSLGGPRMHYWRAQEWSWLGSARLRCPKKDRRCLRIVSDKNGCPVRDRTSSFETKSVQWIWSIRLRHQLSSASVFFDNEEVTDLRSIEEYWQWMTVIIISGRIKLNSQLWKQLAATGFKPR